MAQIYFKNGEKEKGLTHLARILEAADDGKHNTSTTATIESRSILPDIPGNIAIDESAPNEDQLSVENDSDKGDDDNE